MSTAAAPAGRVCRVCVMDTSDPDIAFDESGRCSHCRRAELLQATVPATEAEAERRLAALGERVRRRTGDYDCLLGLSGGFDSSYAAFLAHRLGLRVLAVHFDNGWNSEIAVSNIRSICDALDFELITYVIDWEEFRDLQRSFLLASVIDVELVTDHAIFAAMIRMAKEHDIPVVLSGTNVATESILPKAWVWPKQDLRNIRAIQARFGTMPLETYPTCGVLRWSLLRYARIGPTYVEILNAARYRKLEAKSTLESEIGWRSYGEKHHESVFTKYYQSHILPTKFGVDKRRAHLSSLVMNGELTRDEALRELERPLYDPAELRIDTEYVAKKLGFTPDELAGILAAAPRAHDDFPSSVLVFRALDDVRERARIRSLQRASSARRR